ncbi:MAG TPA: ABC transporter ATP-binding protein, partial [Clostridiales bacterium]|nr:ABC transporter ATP-binding protein [Clostridiales bacterium]
MTMHLLELKNVSVSYDAVTALQDCSLYIDEGEMISIVGSNGAGKTTTCKAISGVLDLKGGTVLFDGKDITKIPGYDRVELGIIQCPEGRHLFPDMTVLENLQMGAYCKRGRKLAEKNLKYVLDLFPILSERSSQAAKTLSGGEQQMLAVGRALMSRPKVIMMDEPSLGLAPIIVKGIFEIIKEINKQGVTVLLIEQNANMAL